MFKSLKMQIASVLAVQFLVLVVIVSFTLYLLDLRKHDYLILNLSGQLRVITQLMATQSVNYTRNAPRDYATYFHDVKISYQQLQDLVTRYDKIINSLEARQLAPELYQSDSLRLVKSAVSVPRIADVSDPIYCTWDKPSRSQMDASGAVWRSFKQGLLKELGNNAQQPRLEAAANYILLHEDQLMQSATELSGAFRHMMEGKLLQITWLNRSAIILSFLIGITLLIFVYRKIFRPMDTTIAGFQRVAQGDLSYRLTENTSNELGRLTSSFNFLADRMHALFGLTDRINQATSLDEIIKFIHQEFSTLLPIDMVAMLRAGVDAKQLSLSHVHTTSNSLGQDMEGLSYSSASRDVQVFDLTAIQVSAQQTANLTLLNRLLGIGMQSMIIVPLQISGSENAALLLAAKQDHAYTAAHQELLGNIALLVGHAFDRSIGMESLVISAVEGLAKLAESRDPETGDHLLRMSLYSYHVAQTISQMEPYREQLEDGFARKVFQFAPMHDIGKVGIEDRILLKPGKLDELEWEAMKTHPIIGADVLRRCERQVQQAGYSMFQVGIEIAEAHHEKYDGSGYPYRRKGTEIPLAARIVAVADVFDALTSKRPYKDAWSVEQALELIRDEAGKHFDPDVVEAFQTALPAILEIYAQHKHV